MRADKQTVTRLLKTARGQLDGILAMVENDRYCVDISNQVMATQSILTKANKEILKAHIGGCVQEAFESGDPALQAEKMDEVLAEQQTPPRRGRGGATKSCISHWERWARFCWRCAL